MCKLRQPPDQEVAETELQARLGGPKGSLGIHIISKAEEYGLEWGLWGGGEVKSESYKSRSEQRPRTAESIQASVLGRRENQ